MPHYDPFLAQMEAVSPTSKPTTPLPDRTRAVIPSFSPPHQPIEIPRCPSCRKPTLHYVPPHLNTTISPNSTSPPMSQNRPISPENKGSGPFHIHPALLPTSPLRDADAFCPDIEMPPTNSEEQQQQQQFIKSNSSSNSSSTSPRSSSSSSSSSCGPHHHCGSCSDCYMAWYEQQFEKENHRQYNRRMKVGRRRSLLREWEDADGQ